MGHPKFKAFAILNPMTKFESQALHVIRIKYWKAGGSGNPPSLIHALWNIRRFTP